MDIGNTNPTEVIRRHELFVVLTIRNRLRI
jgi:hypothetical protein